MSFYTWRERCNIAYRAEAATGLTHEQIIAFLQPGACCSWRPGVDSRILDAMYRSPGLPPTRPKLRKPVAAKWAHITEYRDEAAPPEYNGVAA